MIKPAAKNPGQQRYSRQIAVLELLDGAFFSGILKIKTHNEVVGCLGGRAFAFTGQQEVDITDAAIAEMSTLYMGLAITDLEDKEQFDAVHSARMVVKGKRVEVEKKRKELKADAIAWGKKVDTEAKRIFGKLEPIETHLINEENK